MQQNKVFFLSSAQADLKDLSNGQATWFFVNPIEFASAQMGLVEFSFTNWFINISAALANNKIYYSDDALDPTKYLITIPQGSYSLTALSDFLTSEQQAALGQVIFSLQPNYSTNKCGILFGNVNNWYVSFSAGTCYAINGFTLNQFVPATKNNTPYYIEYGTSIASYNNITSLQVSCNLTTDSISNGKSSSVIYQTSPTSEVGSTQNSVAQNIVYSTLTNTRFSSITIKITDQNDNPIVFSEDFSLSLLIRY